MSILRLRNSIQAGEDHSACPDKRSDPPVNTASMCIPSSDQVWFHVAPIVLPNLTAQRGRRGVFCLAQDVQQALSLNCTCGRHAKGDTPYYRYHRPGKKSIIKSK